MLYCSIVIVVGRTIQKSNFENLDVAIELVNEESIEDFVTMRTHQRGIFMGLQSMAEIKKIDVRNRPCS
jgi:hypothetical protein